MLAVLVAGALACLVEAGPPAPLTVSAAISLSDVLEEVAMAYAKAGGGPIRFNFAGSNALARQIVNGAPVDVFISADEAQMDFVVGSGAIAPGSAVVVASNQLVVVVASGRRLEEVRAAFGRASPEIRRLAVGDPAAVPAGVYARAYLTGQGLWEWYQDRIVPMPNVRAALSAVENGSVDAAIVYATDARRARNAAVALVVPIDQAPPIVYRAAVPARSRQRTEAARFVKFLLGAEVRAILARFGFLPPPGASGH